jgi:hypothetical protein
MVHLDPPRGTRALYERIADLIGLKVVPPSGCNLMTTQHMYCNTLACISMADHRS